MSIEANKSLVGRYVAEIINAHNLAALGEFVTPGYRRYLSPSIDPLTLDGQRQRLGSLLNAFPDICLAIEDVVAEGDRVTFRGTLTGTHQGAFLGIAATHRQVRVFASDTVRIEDGTLAEHWGGPDVFSILQELGASFAAAPTKG